MGEAKEFCDLLYWVKDSDIQLRDISIFSPLPPNVYYVQNTLSNLQELAYLILIIRLQADIVAASVLQTKRLRYEKVIAHVIELKEAHSEFQGCQSDPKHCSRQQLYQL